MHYDERISWTETVRKRIVCARACMRVLVCVYLQQFDSAPYEINFRWLLTISPPDSSGLADWKHAGNPRKRKLRALLVKAGYIVLLDGKAPSQRLHRPLLRMRISRTKW